MNNQFIEKKLEEMIPEYSNLALFDEDCVDGYRMVRAKEWLTTALTEALLAGIELAEGVVKGERWESHDMGNDPRKEFSVIELNELCLKSHNCGIDDTLSRLTSTKESISSTGV